VEEVSKNRSRGGKGSACRPEKGPKNRLVAWTGRHFLKKEVVRKREYQPTINRTSEAGLRKEGKAAGEESRKDCGRGGAIFLEAKEVVRTGPERPQY